MLHIVSTQRFEQVKKNIPEIGDLYPLHLQIPRILIVLANVIFGEQAHEGLGVVNSIPNDGGERHGAKASGGRVMGEW